jgi:hypothetical protein
VQKIFCLLALSFCSSCKFEIATPRSNQPIPSASSTSRLNQAEKAYDFLKSKIEFDAFIAIKNDRIISSWGKIALPINTHSARKSMMSLLYGITIEKGDLSLNQTLENLSIDNTKVPLTNKS